MSKLQEWLSYTPPGERHPVQRGPGTCPVLCAQSGEVLLAELQLSGCESLAAVSHGIPVQA